MDHQLWACQLYTGIESVQFLGNHTAPERRSVIPRFSFEKLGT